MAKNKKPKRNYSEMANTADSLEQSMDSLMKKYNKLFDGDSPLMAIRASEYEDMESIKPIATGHVSFDLMTGIGGLPCGKIIEFTGQEGSHKSNFAWECVGRVHQSDPYAYCVWIDAEKAIDFRIPAQRRHVSHMNVDFNRLIVIVPNTAEQCWKAIMEACSENASLVVLDSISALIPQREFNDDIEKDGYPALPASINKGLRKISTELYVTGTTLIEINQVRENIGADRYTPFEEKWKTTGGKGLKHWLSLRLFFSKSKLKRENADGQKEHIGDKVEVTIFKTRLSPIRGNAQMFMYHRFGFDLIEEAVTMAIKWNVLYKEKKTSRNFMWAGHEELDSCSWSEWYDFFLDSESDYEALVADISDAYEAYYDENSAIEEEAEALDNEYSEEE